MLGLLEVAAILVEVSSISGFATATSVVSAWLPFRPRWHLWRRSLLIERSAASIRNLSDDVSLKLALCVLANVRARRLLDDGEFVASTQQRWDVSALAAELKLLEHLVLDAVALIDVLLLSFYFLGPLEALDCDIQSSHEHLAPKIVFLL